MKSGKAKAQAELDKIEAMLAAHHAGALTKEFYEAISGKALPNVTLKAALDAWLIEARPPGERTIEKYEGLAPDDFWRYMVLGGFFAGLRLGDLATMPIGAVDFKSKVINLTSRKTGTPMCIPIAVPLYQLLKKLAAERKGAKATDPFWPCATVRGNRRRMVFAAVL